MTGENLPTREDAQQRPTERIGDDVGRQLVSSELGVDLGFVPPGANGRGRETDPLPCEDIERSVAEDRAGREVDIPIPASLFEQRRAGLAAGAPVLRGVRAIVERVDSSPTHSQELVQAKMDSLDIVDRVEPALNARLVRHADDEEPVPMGKSEGVGDPPVELELRRVLEVVKVGIEGPIPIDKNRSTRVHRGRRERPPAFSGRTVTQDKGS